MSSPCPPEPASSGPARILIVEDNPADLFLMREAILKVLPDASITTLPDGEDAMSYIDAVEAEHLPCPDLLILDLNLPRIGGHELLSYLRSGTQCKRIPVVIASSSDYHYDREESERLSASAYFRKPPSYGEYLKLGAVVRDLIAARPQI